MFYPLTWVICIFKSMMVISPFRSTVYFMYLGAPMQNEWTFTNVMSLLNWLFYCPVPSLSLITAFVLESILSEITWAITVFFHLSCLHLHSVSLHLKQICCRQHTGGFCFFIHSVTQLFFLLDNLVHWHLE